MARDLKWLVTWAIFLAGGKTQALSDSIGFSVLSIRRWKSGKATPGAQSVAALHSWVESAMESSGPWGGSECPLCGRGQEGSSGERKKGCGGEKTGEIGVNSGEAEKSEIVAVEGAVEGSVEGSVEPSAVPLVEVPAGTDVPGVGRVYAPAMVAGLAHAPPPRLTVKEEVQRGLVELREACADPDFHADAWLVEACRRAKGLGSLATWLGDGGDGVVDQGLALERAQGMAEVLGQPIYSRRLWGHVATLLVKRGAVPRGGHAARRGALARARKAGR